MTKVYFLAIVLTLWLGEVKAQCNGGNPSTNYNISYNSAISIESNFNNAHRWEEIDRSLTTNCLGSLTAPPGGWGTLTDIQRALYIIQSERAARGLLPLEGMEANLNSVSAAHSQWMLSNDKFSHTGNPALGTSENEGATACQTAFNGSSFGERINSSPNIANCWQTASENIGIVTSSRDVVASVIYNMMYRDQGSSWGHRVNFLKVFTNDYGSAAHEGFIGIGIAQGGNYLWPSLVQGSCVRFNVKLITFNPYDPRASGCTYSPVGGSTNCQDLLTLTNNIASNTYQAKEITATGSVANSSIVKLIAQNGINLNMLFETVLGGDLTAEISPCPTNFQEKDASETKSNQPDLILILPN